MRALTILAVSPDVHWIPITLPSLSLTSAKSLSFLFALNIESQSISEFVISSRAPLISFSPVMSFLLMINSFGASSMITLVPSSDIDVFPVVTASTLLTLPFSSMNVNSETTSYPSGEAVSTRVYLPFFRYSKFAEFPSKSTSLTSPSASPPFILTPASVAPSSLQMRVNLAFPASSGSSSPPSAFLSIVITDFVSNTSRTVPSSETLASPSVFTVTFFTTPFSISNVNFVTVVNPSGAAVSSRLYLPSFKPSNFVPFPSNSTSVTLPSASPSFILTPSSVLPSSSVESTNFAPPASAGISSPPSAFLLILIIDFVSNTSRTVPSSETLASPSVFTVTFFTTPFSISNVNFVTVVNPSGAAVSSRLYLPSFKPSNFVPFPSNSTSVTLPSASPSLIFTPSSVLPSSSVESTNFAPPASAGISSPPSAFLFM